MEIRLEHLSTCVKEKETEFIFSVNGDIYRTVIPNKVLKHQNIYPISDIKGLENQMTLVIKKSKVVKVYKVMSHPANSIVWKMWLVRRHKKDPCA